MNLLFSLPAPLLLSLSRPRLVAALVIGVEWLPDCVSPTFQLMGSGERVFISPKQTHPTASWGLLWRGMWVCVDRGDFSLRFYLQITQMLSFTTSRSCYRTDFLKLITHSQYITFIQMLQTCSPTHPPLWILILHIVLLHHLYYMKSNLLKHNDIHSFQYLKKQLLSATKCPIVWSIDN